MKLPTWAAAIDEELSKFEVSNCLHAVPDTGQHKVPMMWLFNTHKVRLVIRGDQIIPFVDFYPNAVYCGNVSACSTKICAKLAATYQLEKRDGDIVGAYLVTKSNLDFRWYIQTPQRYKVLEGQVIEAVGAPPHLRCPTSRSELFNGIRSLCHRVRVQEHLWHCPALQTHPCLCSLDLYKSTTPGYIFVQVK
jgi:hypothetical protein